MGRGDARRAALAAHGLADREVYHLTAIENVPSILDDGLRSYVAMKDIEHADISIGSAQARRDPKRVPVGLGLELPLHEMVPLFFTWSTPMVFKRARERSRRLALLVYSLADLCSDEFEIGFSSMNAAADAVRFEYEFDKIGSHVPWRDMVPKYWKGTDDEGIEWNRSAERGAELLVAPEIPGKLVRRIEVRDFSSYWALISDDRAWWEERVWCEPSHFFDEPYAKYSRLEEDLFTQFAPFEGTKPVKVEQTFRNIGFLVGGLPEAAFHQEAWWTSTSSLQSRAWRSYRVTVDLARQVVAFEQRSP